MRNGFIGACLMIPIAGCSGPHEPEECERHLLGELRSPSTFKQIKKNSVTTPIKLEELQLRYLPEELDKFDRLILADLSKARALALETVTIEYDAANAYGTPVRGEKVCYFLKKDDARYETPFAIVEERADASIRQTDREFRRNASFKEEENFSFVINCCLPF